MTKNNFKVLLFAFMIVAMILPFSVMSFVDAISNDKTNDEVKEPQPPTLREIQDNLLAQTPKEKHEPIHDIGEYPAPRDLS